MFQPAQNRDIHHISVAQSIQLLAVVPATANMLGKFAHGIADDFLSTLYLSNPAPVLIAPAMNVEMWRHPAVQANVEILKARGTSFRRSGTRHARVRHGRGWTIGDGGRHRLPHPRSAAGRRIPGGFEGPGYGGADGRRHRSHPVYFQSELRENGVCRRADGATDEARRCFLFPARRVSKLPREFILSRCARPRK